MKNTTKSSLDYVNALRGNEIIEKIPEDFIEFNKWIGLPKKNGKEYPIFDYELDFVNAVLQDKHVWVCKATGLGITEISIRLMIWLGLTKKPKTRMLVITGPNLELAKNIISRTKKILDNKPFLIKESKATSLTLNNDTIIQAQPSNHIDASRSFDDISLFLADEANFFIKTSNQDDGLVRNVIERYIGKTDPYILLVSTPYYPKGFFFDIGNELQCNYRRFWLDYKVGLGKIYAHEEIEQQKTSPSFPSEYCLQWGMGSGDIFTELNIESYDLQQTSNAVISIDPAYGSSKFAIIVAENRNGVIHILSAKQYSRPTQTAMIRNIQNYLSEYTITDIIADSSNAGLITELKQYCRVIPFNFRQQAQEATVNAVKLMNEKKVMIHPHFKDLIQDLTLARFNNNGTVDKRIMNMDLFDSFIMAVDKLKQTPLKVFKLRNYGNNYRRDYRIE